VKKEEGGEGIQPHHHQNLTEKDEEVRSGGANIHEVVTPGVENATKAGRGTPTTMIDPGEVGREVLADDLIGNMMTGRGADRVVREENTESVTRLILVVRDKTKRI